jgi:signal transduction histidine kinase/DNA-binding response OmpR family regulator
LYKYDIAAQQFTDYTQQANTNNFVIFNIVAGNNGRIWISSDKQVVEFDPPTGASIRYDAWNDLILTYLHSNSAVSIHDGSIVFGGNRGICLFTASSQLNMPCKNTKTVITDIKINGKSILQREGNRQNPDRQKPLVLLPNETNVEIDFSSFNYQHAGKTRYACKLEGVDEQWTYMEPGRNFAVYNQLRKGKYTFLVKSTGDNQLWSDAITRLTVIKKPMFYETGWAYAFYAVVILFTLLAGLRLYTNRIRLRNELHIAQMDKEKSEELIQTKLRFFTNIGHEFRTPLTLIMTPLSTLIHQLSDENLKHKLSSIYRNAEDMLGLINQLLDFRKLEMGGEKLKLSCNDFVKFAEYVYLSFRDVAENKSIQFTFESEIGQLFMGFDKSKVRKIIHNLYSNALKFTPEEGYIATTVRLVQENGREFVRLDMADSGCGIPDNEQQLIFKRFYQSENNDPDKTGSGIGLHLVKEYVELHGGHISVGSKINEGSVFSIILPADLQVDCNTEQDDMHAGASSLPTETGSDPNQGERKTLLIVEDNAELRHFLAEQLTDRFKVLQASDGKQGADLALKKFPDLIVSDLMMPVMNGLEMCQRLKTDIQTSHIPVILLTAKLSDETKIDSYKSGADSYIAKPFNFEVLLTRIEMLIEQQEKRRKQFHKTIEITPGSITTSLDEELIRKALLVVEKNMNNSEYSVDELASELALSRRQLSRKFQSIIGLSPGEFIRSLRLKRAAQLLKDSQYNVSEISDMIGFGSIKYFNLHFKEAFGVTPTQYRASHEDVTHDKDA